jgi:hypothetical protein
MTRVHVKQGRGLVAVVALLALAVAACGSGGSPTLPGNNNTAGNGGTSQPGGTGGGTGFSGGLTANLNKLDSYKFSWSIVGSDSSETASSGGGTSGTVINKPTKATLIDFSGTQYITIADQQWMSEDSGASWIASPVLVPLDAFLPTQNYVAYFDAYATTYKQVGTDNKNGIDCLHFQGDLTALAGVLSNFGVVTNMQADLWVAKDGSYPVKGLFSYSVAAGGSSGAIGYSFDITNVNDPANKVEKPANVTELPS